MKYFLFLLFCTSFCTWRAYAIGPYAALWCYYFYAVLRPQSLWRWHLASLPDFLAGLQWSLFLAANTWIAYLLWAGESTGLRVDRTRSVLPRFNLAHRMVIVYFLWQGVSCYFASDFNVAWNAYFESLKILIMYIAASRIVRTVAQLWGIYLMIPLTLGYICIDLNLEYLMNGFLRLTKEGFGGLDNNGAALVLAMGIPICWFAWEMTRGTHRWLYLALIPPILHIVVSSFSRGAMVSLLSCLITIPLYSRKKKWFFGAAGCVALLIPFLAGDEIRARFFTIGEASSDESFQSRLGSWDAALRIANDYPIFGAGPRCSNLISRLYGADMEGRTIHNLYLQIAADNGWVGLFFLLAMIITTMFTIHAARFRIARYREPTADLSYALLGGVESSLWVFFIGAFALSLEAVELPFILMLIGSQIAALLNARVDGQSSLPAARPPVRAATPEELSMAELAEKSERRMQQIGLGRSRKALAPRSEPTRTPPRPGNR